MAATEEYFEAEDALGRWLDECCLQGPNYTELSADPVRVLEGLGRGGGRVCRQSAPFQRPAGRPRLREMPPRAESARAFQGLTLRDQTRSPTDLEF